MTPLFRAILIMASIGTLIGIVRKVRNAKVQIESSVFWIGFSTLLLFLSIFPQVAEAVADLLGIYSTVNFIFLFVIFVLFIHQFTNSIKISQLEDRIKELTQEIAVRELRKKDLESFEEEKKNEENNSNRM